MLTLPSSVRVYLAVEPVDLRRGHDGLVAIVRSEWKLNPFAGHLFVFFGLTEEYAGAVGAAGATGEEPVEVQPGDVSELELGGGGRRWGRATSRALDPGSTSLKCLFQNACRLDSAARRACSPPSPPAEASAPASPSTAASSSTARQRARPL